jgi:hypothetical protein
MAVYGIASPVCAHLLHFLVSSLELISRTLEHLRDRKGREAVGIGKKESPLSPYEGSS